MSSSSSSEDAARLARAKVRQGALRVSAHSAPRAAAGPPPLTTAPAPAPPTLLSQSYPYARPRSSFIYINGHAFVFDCAAWPAVARGAAWLTDLPVRAPDELLRPQQQQDGEAAAAPPTLLLSVAEACERFFGFCARRALELPPDDGREQQHQHQQHQRHRHHFTPILAVGSNAGVSQIARKFPLELFRDAGGVVVPVVRAVLDDFDVAYAPLVTSYGSAPATLHPSPGTRVELFVTHLSPRQARRMHETEGAYNLQRLTGVALREGAGLEHVGAAGAEPTATQLLTYGHQAGTLSLRFRRGPRRREDDDDGDDDGDDGAEHLETPVALAEINALGRRFPALTQTQILRAVRRALADAEESEDGRGQAAAGNGSSSSRIDADTDALPPPKPLPPILAPEHAANCWMATDEADLDAFLLRCLDCADTRRRRVALLTAAAVPFARALPDGHGVEVLETMGTVLSDNVK
jgi:hypothetical protein